MELTARRTKALNIKIGDETLDVTYRPAYMTPAYVREAEASAKRLIEAVGEAAKESAPKNALKENAKPLTAEEEAARALTVAETLEKIWEGTAKQITEIVVKWNLVEDGEPVPLTLDGLRVHQVDNEMMRFIINCCRDDQRVPLVNAAPSATPS